MNLKRPANDLRHETAGNVVLEIAVAILAFGVILLPVADTI